jgi:hypothetical protein
MDDQPTQNTNNNTCDMKSKRKELSSDDDGDFDSRSKKPTANVTKAVDFVSHVYSNNAVMGSSHDINYQLLDKFNKIYSSDQTRDESAKSYMGLSHLDSSLSAKVGGTSKFTSRRDYQEAMAPRGTSAQTSDNDSECQTRPPVLRLRGASKLDLGESDCRSEVDTSYLAQKDTDSSVNESYTFDEEETQYERFESDMLSAMERIPGTDQQTESLGSKISVMRLRGGAPKKRRRRAYFQAASANPLTR